jgi:DMSO/TMAO reductase YedYZ molybdopterin-dependent catalytic subunit
VVTEPGGLWAPAPRPAGRPEPIVHEQEPLNQEWPVAWQQGWVTPAERFYDRNHFRFPEVHRGEWTTAVEGHVERPGVWGLASLRRLAATSLWAVLECSGNKRALFQPKPEGDPWLGGAVGNAEWTGVPLRAVLEQAGVKPGARWVRFTGADAGRFQETGRWVHFERALPLAVAMDPQVLLAWQMNGQPLPFRHGGPLRLVVPGWYGMASVKWLIRIEVRQEPFTGPFQVRDYVYLPEPGAYDRAVPVTIGKVNSIITHPAGGSSQRPGRLVVRGFAWGGAAPVERVEVSLDQGGHWVQAQLAEPVSRYSWRAWSHTLQSIRPGSYAVAVRATDQAGNLQPTEAPWNAKGYGNNSVSVTQVTVSLRPTSRLALRPLPAPGPVPPMPGPLP